MEALTPHQLAYEGKAEYERGEYLSAAKLYKAAADGFLACGNVVSAAEMANNCSVAYLQAGDANSALNAVVGSEVVFATEGDILRQALAIGNQAAALKELKQRDKAIIAYEKSADLLKQIGEFEMRAYVLQSISSLQLRGGHYLEAYASMREGVMGINKPNLKQRIIKKLIQLPFKLIK